MNNSARNGSDMHTYNKIGGWTTDNPRLYTFLAEYYASENILKKWIYGTEITGLAKLAK